MTGTSTLRDLIPEGPYASNLSLYNIGDTSRRWNSIWAGTLNIGTSTFSLKSDSASSLGFFTAANGGGTQALTLTSAGNVGIGTTSPLVKLDVTGVIRAGNGAGYGTVTLNAASANDDVTRTGYIGWFGSNGTRYGYMGNQTGKISLELENSATYLINGGNVGIGTTSPWGLLSVNPNGITGPAFVIGSSTATNFIVTNGGRVGIGTTSPASLLTISGSGANLYINDTGTAPKLTLWDGSENVGYTMQRTGDGLLTTIGTQTTFSAYKWLTNASSEVMRITNGGNVGIGQTNPNDGKLEVKGGTVCVDTNSDDSATSCIANESDERLKENIAALSASSSLETILALRPVSFDWRASDPEILKHYPLIGRFASSTHYIGLVAQQVAPLVPEAIEQETVGDAQVQYYQLDYTKFIPHLVGAIQALFARVSELATIIASFAESFTSHRVSTDELCVGSACITETQLAALLSQSAAASLANPSPTPIDAATTPTPESSMSPAPSDAATSSPDVYTEPVERVTESAPPVTEPTTIIDSPPPAPEEEPEPAPTPTTAIE